MLGNVWEWCSDWFGNYEAGSQASPAGPKEGDLKGKCQSKHTVERLKQPDFRQRLTRKFSGA